MKIRLFSLILFGMLIGSSAYSQFAYPNGTNTIVNQLQFNIDTETNEITFNLACDPCTYSDGGSDCECRKDCADAGYTQADYIEFEDCIDKCHEDYSNDPVNEDYCLDACEAGLYSTERICLEDCGPIVPRRKTAESFAFAYDLWWTTGIFESMNGAADESFISPIINGLPGNLVHNSTQDFMDQTISFCINYQFFV